MIGPCANSIAPSQPPGANRLRDAHAALDAAVRAAYGMSDREDTLAFLLRLNLGLTSERVRRRGFILFAILAAVSR
jgi:hypothetical protein